MLTFYAELDGTGSYLSRPHEVRYGTTPKVGFSFPGYIVGLKRNVLLTKRSSLDYLKTGKAKFARDHDCNNLQITADIAIPVALEGPYLRPYDTKYGVVASRWHQPGSAVGYDISDVKAAFGTAYDVDRRWEYRDSSCPIMDDDSPSVPIIFERGYVRSYAAEMSNSSSYRYSIMSSLGVAYSVPTAVKEKPMYVFHRVAYGRDFTESGSLYRSIIYAETSVLACGPREAGATMEYTLYLRPVDQVWTTQHTPYLNPTILQSMPEATVRQCFYTPSMLYGQSKINPLVSLKLPRWGAVNPYKRLTASYDSDFPTLFRYDKAVTTYVWQRLYRRKSHPTPTEWEELGDTAADNVNQVSINSLAYMRDLRTSLDTLRATIALAGHPTNLKSWASWWLSLRYGDRLTYCDTVELSKAVASDIVSRSKGWNKDYYTSQARDSTTEYSVEDNSWLEIQRFTKLYYKPKWDDWISKAIVASMKWDLWPTLGNSWDLIPFSFVVDWFVDVQSILERIDRQNLMLMHHVLSVIQTEKSIYTFDDIGIDNLWVTNFKAVAYSRQISRSLPSSPFRVDRGHFATINIIDGISLMFQT